MPRVCCASDHALSFVFVVLSILSLSPPPDLFFPWAERIQDLTAKLQHSEKIADESVRGVKNTSRDVEQTAAKLEATENELRALKASNLETEKVVLRNPPIVSAPRSSCSSWSWPTETGRAGPPPEACGERPREGRGQG